MRNCLTYFSPTRMLYSIRAMSRFETSAAFTLNLSETKEQSLKWGRWNEDSGILISLTYLELQKWRSWNLSNIPSKKYFWLSGLWRKSFSKVYDRDWGPAFEDQICCLSRSSAEIKGTTELKEDFNIYQFNMSRIHEYIWCFVKCTYSQIPRLYPLNILERHDFSSMV